MSAPPDEARAARTRRGGRRQVTVPFLAGILTALLAFQFLLGTYLNLYVTIPAGRDLGALSLDGLVVLVLHIIVGIMVIGTSLRMTLVAVRSKDRRQIGLSAVAAIGMILAFLAGADFTFGSQGDASSFVMAFGFFLGMLCSALLIAGVHLPRPQAETGDTVGSR